MKGGTIVKHQIHVGPEIRSINNIMMRKMDCMATRQGEDATIMIHGWVLGYLYNQKERDIYQKDIEKEFRLSRAAVTCILKALEEKGCIKRESVDFDARLKRIALLPKGIEIHKKSFDNIKLMEEILKENIEEDELIIFLKVVNQMKNNLLESDKLK